MGKDPVRRHKRHDFPPWQQFICIYTGMSPAVRSLHWRMHGGAKIRRFASFRLAVLTSTGPLFWFVWTEHERTHALKDRDWNDFVKLLQWANFHGIRCSCHPSASTQGWYESWSTSVSLCLVGSKTHGLVGPTIATQAPVSPAQPVAWLSKTLWCEDFSCSAEVLCWPRKVASRHDKQAETDLAIQFAWRRWLRHRLPSANTLAPRFASAEFAETWYLD